MPQPTVAEHNAIAIAETLVHHGKLMQEMYDDLQNTKRQFVALDTELSIQKGLIVRSLQNKYGHGSTSGE